MRTPIMAGNWKMNKTLDESVELIKQLAPQVADIKDRVALVIPTYIAITEVKKAIEGTPISLGAQNLHHEPSGAYTAEISAPMLVAAKCEYVVIGHSERRQFFGETNQGCNLKIHAANEAGLIPIYCIGETIEQRESGTTLPLMEIQVKEGLEGVSADQAAKMVLAYEPVWAIGTGKTATKEQAQEVHAFIRQVLAKLYDQETADQIRILYGGSVKPTNVDELMAMPDIDGALVGGASLTADSFARIVNFE